MPRGAQHKKRAESAPRTPHEIEQALTLDVAACQYDPARFIWYAFPWGQPGLLREKKPRKWTLDVCASIRAKLLANLGKPVNAWQIVQEAIASGHGPGKSAFIAQLILWALSTFEKTRGIVTANTETQLRTKSWPELVKWHGMCMTRHWFTVTATAIHHRLHIREWRVDAIPWSANNCEAFAGLHNQGRRLFIAYDEASSIDDPVWETTEGALTDEGTEIIWIAAGNPTRARGRFRQCFTSQAHLWGHRNIDSRTVEGVNLDRIERWRRLYGENSQFFNVRVKGQFVEADANQLISLEWIAEARLRGLRAEPDGSVAKLRISTDVADGGEDDTVATVARHYQSFRHVLKQKAASFASSVAPIESAELTARLWTAWEGNTQRGDDIVVDSIGVGAGTAGKLMKDGLPVIAYKGGEASANAKMYRNRRVQSHIAMRNDFRDAMIALDPQMLEDEEAWSEFEEQLCSIRVKPGTEKLEDLVTKEEMRRDGLKSPDRAESLAMQYATQYPTLVRSQSAPSEEEVSYSLKSTLLEEML
jgi:hypothetical protein